jgi:hypothetical protein
MRAKATMHVRLGCKRLSHTAWEPAAVGAAREAGKLGVLNIKKQLQPEKSRSTLACPSTRRFAVKGSLSVPRLSRPTQFSHPFVAECDCERIPRTN